MTITLTTTGWTGSSNGVWTGGANIVTDNVGGVVNPGLTIANTLSGKDSITGARGIDTSQASLLQFIKNNPFVDPDVKSKVYLSFGVENLGSIIMGKDSNRITGTSFDRTEFSLAIGIYNELGSSIAMEGNKNTITGIAEGGNGLNFPGIVTIAGIFNRSGSIAISNGNNNAITGIGKAIPVNVDEGTGFYASGIFNRQGGTISIGNGNNNSIAGTGGYLNGIFNRGVITIGDGNNNSISGTGISDGCYGIYNQTVTDSPSIIRMGNGNNNSLTGIAEGSRSIGVFNDKGSIIAMGDGNNDSITGIAKGSHGVGIYNEADGIMTMGNGNDTINGKSIGNDGFGIHNSGIIDAGGGDDKLHASVNTNDVLQKVTIDGGGIIKMGLGKDLFQGFGNMIAYGDNGTGNINKKDILDLSLFNSCDFTIDKMGVGDPTAGANYAKFTYADPLLGAVSMTTNEFDEFVFADKTLNYSQLGI